jgi:hypothetical protein
MKAPRLYLCEGYCRFFGQIRSIIAAAGLGEARTKFFTKHGIQALHVCLER